MLVMNCAIVVQMYVINKQPNDNTIFIYVYIRFLCHLYILLDWLNEIYIHNRGRVDARNAVVYVGSRWLADWGCFWENYATNNSK